MKYWKTILLLALFTGLGILGGYWYAFQSEGDLLSEVKQVREADSSYHLISPLLAVDFSDSVTFREYTELEDKIQKKIDGFYKDRKVEDVSVYFRDLRNGHWVGINENDSYAPASLLKLPVLIAYLKQAETEPEILQRKIRFNAQEFPDEMQNETEHALVSGMEYSVQELLDNMIIYSDNISFTLLLRNVDQDALQEVFTDLGIHFPGDDGKNQYFISAKSYSLFFRILRNSTLLNREMSEAALQLLSKADFHDGLAAGIPSDVTIAHKFGIYRMPGEVGLHDCGIVYEPDKPYILCVMTKGSRTTDLEEVIKDISKLVYEEVQ